MIRVALSVVALAAVANGFTCMTDCRKPLWTCINKGIPGHEIALLQQCVKNDVDSGMWAAETACIACIGVVTTGATTWPTAAPVTPAPVASGGGGVIAACDTLTRKKHCQGTPSCIWTTENTAKGECMATADSSMTPSPTDAAGYIDQMQPCLTYCRDQAMDCAFTHGVDTTCVPCMRECVYTVAFDDGPANTALYKPECGKCIADVFEVLGDPQNPPAAGFALFSDYQKWMKNKGVQQSCKDSGGKWKVGKTKTRCVPPKNEKKLRCKKIKDMAVCAAVGCAENTKKARCAGASKWKTAKPGKNKGGR